MQKTKKMKPSEVKKTIEKQIADLEINRYNKIREIWEIEAKIARKKEILTKFQTNELGRDDK